MGKKSSSAVRKALRAKSYENGQTRKAARKKREDEAHARNLRTIADGGQTPVMKARERRFLARAEKRKEFYRSAKPSAQPAEPAA